MIGELSRDCESVTHGLELNPTRVPSFGVGLESIAVDPLPSCKSQLPTRPAELSGVARL